MPGIDECLLEAMSLPGARGASLVDWTSGLALGTAGDSPVGDHETTAAETAELARAAAEYDSFARDSAPGAPHGAASREGALPGGALSGGALRGGASSGGALSDGPPEGQGPAVEGFEGPPVEDVIVTTRGGYHILRFVETAFDSSVFLHLWLDRDRGNLALARIRLRELAEKLVLG
ncbi:hypothetical protein J7E93_00125 [Streptomyces sp. ISL-36]|uniref:hypothetical protein n=1 Tax=Streptomyces sp. ISL-36 TaxID=2819182 RepID=UPI001BE8F624|nr:hypothetical protein [Streptomyces sp. ISL-36]MBT2438558.1 hypothetical protein [Streptomyces sp. ISL-36]